MPFDRFKVLGSRHEVRLLSADVGQSLYRSFSFCVLTKAPSTPLMIERGADVLAMPSTFLGTLPLL